MKNKQYEQLVKNLIDLNNEAKNVILNDYDVLLFNMPQRYKKIYIKNANNRFHYSSQLLITLNALSVKDLEGINKTYAKINSSKKARKRDCKAIKTTS